MPEEVILAQPDNPKYAVHFWGKDNGRIEEGKLAIRRYRGKPQYGLSEDKPRWEEGSVVFARSGRGALFGYDRQLDEHFLLFHCDNKYEGPSVLAKVDSWLLVGLWGEGLVAVDLEDCGPVVIADTVGFIRHLPHKLVEAFSATLEETCSANLLLHVIDAAHEERHDNVIQVEAVLAEIGAQELPRLEVYNKLDLLDQQPRIDRDSEGRPQRVWLSAQSGAGTELLRQAMAELLGGELVQHRLKLAPEQGRLRARLYQLGVVLQEEHGSDGCSRLLVRLPHTQWRRLLAVEGISEDSVLHRVAGAGDIRVRA